MPFHNPHQSRNRPHALHLDLDLTVEKTQTQISEHGRQGEGIKPGGTRPGGIERKAAPIEKPGRTMQEEGAKAGGARLGGTERKAGPAEKPGRTMPGEEIKPGAGGTIQKESGHGGGVRKGPGSEGGDGPVRKGGPSGKSE